MVWGEPSLAIFGTKQSAFPLGGGNFDVSRPTGRWAREWWFKTSLFGLWNYIGKFEWWDLSLR